MSDLDVPRSCFDRVDQLLLVETVIQQGSERASRTHQKQKAQEEQDRQRDREQLTIAASIPKPHYSYADKVCLSVLLYIYTQ